MSCGEGVPREREREKRGEERREECEEEDKVLGVPDSQWPHISNSTVISIHIPRLLYTSHTHTQRERERDRGKERVRHVRVSHKLCKRARGQEKPQVSETNSQDH